MSVPVINCAACGADNPAAAKFCAECGTGLTRSCAACGAALTASQRFCGECGTPQSGVAAAPVAAPVAQVPVAQAERRTCTVLFVDLVGFTPFTESRDAEDVRDMLSQYYERARTIIERYGGVVEKFIGDAVMAVWGTPVATEGDAERAVRAGLDVVAAVAELGVGIGTPDLRARAGAVTGDIAVTINVGENGTQGIAGDTVNTAARVQGAAEPGTVWVDDVTERITHAAIGYRDAGEHVLKGKAEPVHLWTATRVLSNVGGVQRVDGLEAPMLGRDAELRTVKDLLHTAIDRRSTRLAVVSGPPGIGKSRLGWEFEKYIDGLADTVLWHRGRCLSYGDGVAFWALAEAVRQRLGIAEEDAADTAGTKLHAGLDAFVPDPAEREYVGARLARLLGVSWGENATLPREELFAGWRLFFERLAATGPVILVIEDAQHADHGLLDFVDHLVDWSREAPIFVLALCRPELADATPGWGVGRNRSTITLDALDTATMDRLVDSLVPDMPATAREAVANQAQGIPLYAVETIRSLIDRDIVVPREGVYRLVGDVSELAVPDTLRGLLAARFDALPADLHSLLADAAVLGTDFPADALVAVSGRDAAEVQRLLAELVRREILDVSADPLSPQRGFYGFSQNLLRQVVYDTLSRRDRKTRHLAVAAHLRTAFANDGDEVVEVVARHYVDALQAAPADADADAVRSEAVALLERSAQRANRSGAPRRASDSLAAAAQLLGDGELIQAAELWERASDLARIAGAMDLAVEQGRIAVDGFTRAQQPRSAARARVRVGRALRTRSSALAMAESALALDALRDLPDAVTVDALGQHATSLFFDGDPEQALVAVDEAMALAQAIGVERKLLAEVFLTRGMVNNALNRTEEALAASLYSIRLTDSAGGAGLELATSLTNVADMLLTHDAAAALDYARRAADGARRIGAQFMLRVSVVNTVAALIWLGRWDEAQDVLTATYAELVGEFSDLDQAQALLLAARGETTAVAEMTGLPARDADDTQDAVYATIIDQFAAEAHGHHEDTVTMALAVLSRAEGMGVTSEQLVWCWTLAYRAARGGGDAAGVSKLEALLDVYPRGHWAPVLRAERALADALGAGSRDAIADAVAMMRAVGSPYHLAHALLDQADVLGAADADAAQACRDEAAALNETMGAATLTARLVAETSTVPPAGFEPATPGLGVRRSIP